MTTIGGPQTAKPLPNIMKWVQIYLVCTVLLYLVGPIHYVKYNTALVLMRIATYQFFLWL